MKNLVFILLFIPLISYSQTDSEFVFQKTFPEQRWSNCISDNNCFSLSWDHINLTIFYTYGLGGNKQAIDTIGNAGIYGLTLNNFKNEKDNSDVVILKMESEYVPFFNVYYLKYGKLMKIGEWTISVPRDKYNCEYCDYSIEDIRIHQRNDEIVFSFLKEVEFVVYSKYYDYDDGDTRLFYNYDDWGTFKAGELKVSFNIVDRSLKVIERD